MRIVVAEAARRDIAEAIEFIARDDPDAAQRQKDRLDQAVRRLVEFPSLGQRLGEGLRRLQVPGTPFRLVYRHQRDEMVILRVWHGARQWPSDPR